MYLKDKGPVRSVTKEEKILSLQCESTKRALKRPVEDDMEWSRRKTPDTWLAVPNASSKEELVGARSIGYQEAKVEETLRRARGGYLSEMRNEPPANSKDEQKKETAANAFMSVFSPDKIKDKFKSIMALCGLGEKVR